MDASIPARAGDGNGDGAPEFGQALLDRALAGAGRRAALLVLDGVDAKFAIGACARVLRQADAATTLAHDRCAVLAPHLRETSGAADLAARLLAALPRAAAPFAAIGIAVAPEDGVVWSDLLAAAEGAVGRAAGYVAGRFAFPDAERDARYRIGPLLAGAIAEALAEDQFRIVYQPIARLADGRPVGAEALLRWPRPGGETWSPADFIPEAERRGLMEPITAWTLRAVCLRLKALGAAAPADFRIGFNLSATMLGAGAAEMAAAVLKGTGAPADRLTFEITETARFIDDPAALADVKALAALGCGVAIDDFGAGHASLAYVVKLPANRIKLDAGLTAAVLDDARARAAIVATARLARDVGADVVAEGITSVDVAAALIALGVELGQGRLYGAPAADLLLDSAGARA